MTTQQQLSKVRKLLKQERYDEARPLLNKINHPKAKSWLAKLDEIAPESVDEGDNIDELLDEDDVEDKASVMVNEVKEEGSSQSKTRPLSTPNHTYEPGPQNYEPSQSKTSIQFASSPALNAIHNMMAGAMMAFFTISIWIFFYLSGTSVGYLYTLYDYVLAREYGLDTPEALTIVLVRFFLAFGILWPIYTALYAIISGSRLKIIAIANRKKRRIIPASPTLPRGHRH